MPVQKKPSDRDTSSTQRGVEDALRDSEIRYRRLFESAKDGILILKADCGEIIDVNPYLADLLGYAREDFLGRHIWDFGPFAHVTACREAFLELQALNYCAYEDLPLETIDGRRIDVWFVSNVYFVNGERFIQCNIRDITARKQAERARVSLEEQFRAIQRMEAIGGLAAGVAHDFNNLISVILCYTEFAMGELPVGNPIRNDLVEVVAASKRAAGLTRQLLAFCRKQVLQPMPVNLNHVVIGVEKMLKRILGEDIELRKVLAPALGWTSADPSQIEQVIMNLVVNARDAMPKGGSLTIETKNVELDTEYAATHVQVKPGPYIQLTVSDTGCGMDEATRARAFDPFFTTKGPGKGTGLGLSTVYGIVTQSGGQIQACSREGPGTTFTIDLPRDLSLALPSSPEPPGKSAGPTAGKETILVVEDDETVRKVARRLLAAAGYSVLTAENGRDALQLFQSHAGHIPLVLTDIVMPQMSGREFAAELLRLSPATKVIFMSGYSGDTIGESGPLPHGSRFLGKPFSAADLTREVRELLDDGSAGVMAGLNS